MAASIEQSLESIFKSGEAIQSFVIDEIALTTLLDKAWRPVGKKILKLAATVIDFKKKRYKKSGVPQLTAWMTEDMYDQELGRIWKKIEPTVKKYIGRSYQRGIDEDGENPFTLKSAKKSAQKSVSSVYAARKAKAIAVLTKMAEGSFTGYAHDVAIPDFYSTIKKLGKIDALVEAYEKQHGKPLDADAKEILRYEQARRLRLEAMDKAQREIIDKFYDKITNQQHAQAIANMATAKAHHFGFLDWAKENGIQYYKVVAVLDAKTCAACAAMDGKVFSVKDALAYKDKFLEIQGDKEKLKQEMPFLTPATAKDVSGINFAKAGSAAARVPELPVRNYMDFAFLGEFEGDYKPTKEEILERLDRAKRWAASHYDDFRDSLSNEEIEAIKTYKGTAYDKINSHLRYGTDIKERYEKTIQKLNAAFEKVPPIQESVITYRGVPNRYFFEESINHVPWTDSVGLTVTLDMGFMSTSLAPNVADTFGNGLKYKIFLPEGAKSAMYLDNIQSAFNNEMEVLIKPGTKFEILQADENTGIVVCKIVE